MPEINVHLYKDNGEGLMIKVYTDDLHTAESYAWSNLCNDGWNVAYAEYADPEPLT
jgi:hypothetical protein